MRGGQLVAGVGQSGRKLDGLVGVALLHQYVGESPDGKGVPIPGSRAKVAKPAGGAQQIGESLVDRPFAGGIASSELVKSPVTGQ
jgi:hypothetical protein